MDIKLIGAAFGHGAKNYGTEEAPLHLKNLYKLSISIGTWSAITTSHNIEDEFGLMHIPLKALDPRVVMGGHYLFCLVKATLI
jgi:hypothetical protein